MKRGWNRLAFVCLSLLTVNAWAVPIRTAFSGEGSWIGGRVVGFFQYDMDEATPDHDNSFSFNGGSTLFVAHRLEDGRVFAGDSFRMSFANDVATHVGCDDALPCDFLRFDASYFDHDPYWARDNSHFYFSVIDRSGSMFAPSVTTLPQTNIPLIVNFPVNGLFQFDEEMTGSLGGFRITNLTPIATLPGPSTFSLFGIGLLGLAARRLRKGK